MQLFLERCRCNTSPLPPIIFIYDCSVFFRAKFTVFHGTERLKVAVTCAKCLQLQIKELILQLVSHRGQCKELCFYAPRQRLQLWLHGSCHRSCLSDRILQEDESAYSRVTADLAQLVIYHQIKVPSCLEQILLSFTPCFAYCTFLTSLLILSSSISRCVPRRESSTASFPDVMEKSS